MRPWLVWYGLAAYAGLVNGPSSSVWRQHTAGGTFVPARTWLGADGVEGDAAAASLVRSYLAAFGPASRADIAQWTGFARSVVARGLARTRACGASATSTTASCYDLPRAPVPSSDVRAPARLLPRFDNLVLSHDDRRRVIADEHRSAVIQGGEVSPTFLVDGFVAGTWSLDDGRVRLEPFAPLPRVCETRARGRSPAARGVRPRARPVAMTWLGPDELRVGLGCMRLPPDEDLALATIAAALEAGITVFDTARAYEENEALLARALRDAAPAHAS